MSSAKSPLQSSPLANKANFDEAIGKIMDIALNHSAQFPMCYQQVCQLLQISNRNKALLKRDYRAFALDAIRTLLYLDYPDLFVEFGEFSVPSDNCNFVTQFLAANPFSNDPEAFLAMLEDQQIQDCRDIFISDSTFGNEAAVPAQLGNPHTPTRPSGGHK